MLELIAGTPNFLLGTILPFIIVLTVVIFFHELGHFWVARRCGVRVETFSICFGRALFSWTDKQGTEWKVGWIPLGGYVKFHGDANAASAPDIETLSAMDQQGRRESYHFQPVGNRIAISAAGPIANFILAVVIFWGIFFSLGQVERMPVASFVAPDGAAAEAGIEVGDQIIKIDDQPIETFNDLQREVALSAGQTLLFTVDRGGALVDLNVTPQWVNREIELPRAEGDKGEIKKQKVEGWKIGITSNKDYTVREFGAIEALGRATEEVWNIISGTVSFIGNLIVGREKAEQLGGPLRIAEVSSDAAEYGIGSLVSLIAILSVSIGLINLFPIPMLDGGHILLYTIEAVRGRPLTDRALEVSYRVGLVLVLSLMVFATLNDLSRYNVFGWVNGLFS